MSAKKTGERLEHTTLYSPLLPTREGFMSSVDAELMRAVEEEQLRERPELASEPQSLRLMHLVEEEGLRERSEFLRLVGQCSILVVIAGIVAVLIAA
jgi:hypothetical protein